MQPVPPPGMGALELSLEQKSRATQEAKAEQIERMMHRSKDEYIKGIVRFIMDDQETVKDIPVPRARQLIFEQVFLTGKHCRTLLAAVLSAASCPIIIVWLIEISVM